MKSVLLAFTLAAATAAPAVATAAAPNPTLLRAVADNQADADRVRVHARQVQRAEREAAAADRQLRAVRIKWNTAIRRGDDAVASLWAQRHRALMEDVAAAAQRARYHARERDVAREEFGQSAQLVRRASAG